jgi:uncharacterized membrane-anchored protein YjiN (DUF445 family)
MRPGRVGAAAKLLLLAAACLAAAGVWLWKSGRSEFWGLALMAFGEAALVGGLADWFAVVALFRKPLGFPFHTAIVPRNRAKIAAQVSRLVADEWLTSALLKEKAASFDFAGALIGSLQSQATVRELAAVVRTVALDVMEDVEPDRFAAWIAGELSRVVGRADLRVQVGSLLGRARREDWLWPFVQEWTGRLETFAGSERSRALIRGALGRAWASYLEGGLVRKVLGKTLEGLGAIDLDDAARALQAQLLETAGKQKQPDSDLHRLLHGGLDRLGERIAADEDFYARVAAVLRAAADPASVEALLRPWIAGMHERLRRELESGGSRAAVWIEATIGRWGSSLAGDSRLAARINERARGILEHLIEKHHAAIGVLVKEQMDRLTDEKLVAMIRDRVGDDLDWIRINGTLVGGTIGLAIFLTVHFLV